MKGGVGGGVLSIFQEQHKNTIIILLPLPPPPPSLFQRVGLNTFSSPELLVLFVPLRPTT